MRLNIQDLGMKLISQNGETYLNAGEAVLAIDRLTKALKALEEEYERMPPGLRKLIRIEVHVGDREAG